MYDYYMEESERLRNIGKDLNLTDSDIDKIIDESFKFLETECAKPKEIFKCCQKQKRALICISSAVVLIGVVCLLVYQWPTIHSYAERHFQLLVYPALKLVRKLVLPIIQRYPSLTEYYDEACLIGNPYFRVSDIDCWPCENVRSILNLTIASLSNEEYHSGLPFIYRDGNLKDVTYKKLMKMYSLRRNIFDKDAGKAENTYFGLSTAEDLFLTNPLASFPTPKKDAHVTWKLNRLEPVRELRQLFGIPKQIPSYVSGATIEKWLLIDEPNSLPYQLPSTEGTTVFLIQGSGSRLISLEPSSECLGSCHRVSILLRPKHILWFNWWYWRGKSHPIKTTNKLSITYVGSYY